MSEEVMEAPGEEPVTPATGQFGCGIVPCWFYKLIRWRLTEGETDSLFNLGYDTWRVEGCWDQPVFDHALERDFYEGPTDQELPPLTKAQRQLLRFRLINVRSGIIRPILIPDRVDWDAIRRRYAYHQRSGIPDGLGEVSTRRRKRRRSRRS